MAINCQLQAQRLPAASSWPAVGGGSAERGPHGETERVQDLEELGRRVPRGTDAVGQRGRVPGCGLSSACLRPSLCGLLCGAAAPLPSQIWVSLQALDIWGLGRCGERKGEEKGKGGGRTHH